MRENVGGVDRIARVVAGPTMMLAGYSWLGGRRGRLAGIATMIGGALLLDTAITKTCSLNAALGIDTAHDAPDSLRIGGGARGDRPQLNPS